MLPLFILIPLGAAVVANLPFGLPRRAAMTLAMLAALLQLAVVAWWPAQISQDAGLFERFFVLSLHADSLSRVLLLCIAIVAVVTVSVATTIKGVRERLHFATILLVAMVGMNGTVLLTDLFSLYVFAEVTSVSSIVLIAFTKGRDALEGAFKYLLLSAVAAVMMLGALALILMVAGTTSFAGVRDALAAGNAQLVVRVAIGIFVCGLFIKSGVVPFHGWVPGAYSAASAPVSILLAGIATKAVGTYALIRVAVSVFPRSEQLNALFLFLGMASIIVGAVAAMNQRHTKNLLAYSSISQIGYIIVGLGCGSPLGIAGAILHLFNHTIGKSLLFVSSASLEERVGTTDMDQMGGLGGKMPATSASALVGILSTAGLPPLAGFWSKLVIVLALWKTQHHAYATLAVLMSLVTLAYLLSMERRVFFGKTPAHLADVKESSWPLVTPAVLLALVAIAVGVLFPLLFGTFLFPPLNLLK